MAEGSPFLKPMEMADIEAALPSQMRGNQPSKVIKALRYLGAACIPLLPSFFAHGRLDTAMEKSKVFSTSYLDGIRGLFSFLVYIRHFLLPWVTELDTGYAQAGEDGETDSRKNLMKLPFLRLVYAGPTVPIFFVVSGFVLTYKPLKLMRGAHHDILFKGLATSVFRRAPRLFLPPMITTLIVAISVQLGFWSAPYDSMPAVVARHPVQFDSLRLQLLDWIRFLFEDLSHPWSWKSPKSEYDSHLWTIPIQFRASMMMYLVLLGLARVHNAVRQAVVAAFWVYTLAEHRWEVALFMAGMLLAERNLIILEGQKQAIHHRQEVSKDGFIPFHGQRIIWIAVFLLGLFLGSYPRAPRAGLDTPGYEWISSLTHNYKYWHAYSAMLLILAITHEGSLQQLFTSRFSRYMGNISFSLYLVHGPVLHGFGYSLASKFVNRMQPETESQYDIGLFAAFLILSPIVIWVADLFWRLVDKPCTTLVVWLENKLSR